MITPNTDFTFIQVKSDNLRTLTWQNGTVAEVIEMTMQIRSGEKWRLDDLLFSVLDETLKQVFREEGTQVIYSFIENKCHLKLEEIVEKPEGFSVGLEKLLGSAAPLIEKMILKNVYSKLELKYDEKDGYGFSDYIKELREKYGC